MNDNGIEPEVFEAVVMDNRSRWTVSRSSGLPACIGIAEDGRILFCVWRFIDDEQIEIQPLTAYEIDR